MIYLIIILLIDLIKKIEIKKPGDSNYLTGEIVDKNELDEENKNLIKNNKYWNSSNLVPKDPVVSNLCSQVDIKNAVDKANRKIDRMKKEMSKKNITIKDQL